MEKIILLHIGCEGGSLELSIEMNYLGIFSYRLQVNSSADVLFPDEDFGKAENEKWGPEDEPPLVIDWAGALALLDGSEWPWPMFFPMFIHPCISDQIVGALMDREKTYPGISFDSWGQCVRESRKMSR